MGKTMDGGERTAKSTYREDKALPTFICNSY